MSQNHHESLLLAAKARRGLHRDLVDGDCPCRANVCGLRCSIGRWMWNMTTSSRIIPHTKQGKGKIKRQTVQPSAKTTFPGEIHTSGICRLTLNVEDVICSCKEVRALMASTRG